MLEPKDKFELPQVGVDHSRSALRGIDDAILMAKLRYLSSVAAAVESDGDWSDVTATRTALEEALLAQAALQRMWPD